MDNKAWDILTKEEKIALNLSINHKKSSWEAGEILGKAHYKYLEIQARAKHFFKIFNIYFQKTENRLIPLESEITWDFQEFLLCTIENRMGFRESYKAIGKDSLLNHKTQEVRVKAMCQHMEALRNHEDPLHQDLYDLIMEFDRWNNFRILPEELQEPSAFKRRNKARLLKHLKNLKKIEPFLIERIVKKFTVSKKYHMRVLYLPIVSDYFPDGYEVLRVKGTAKVTDYISKSLQLYMFKDKDDAQEYAEMVEEHLNRENKTCKVGQKFWPKYRRLIKKASNHDLIHNIIPRRKNLEYAITNINIDSAVLAKDRKKSDDNKASKWKI